MAPTLIGSMQIGGSLLDDRADGEVRYYYHDANRRVRSVFPDGTGAVPWPYGGFYVRGKDSSGGWIGSAVDPGPVGVRLGWQSAAVSIIAGNGWI